MNKYLCLEWPQNWFLMDWYLAVAFEDTALDSQIKFIDTYV